MSSAKFTKQEVIVSKPVISFVVYDTNDGKRVAADISIGEALNLIDALLDAIVEADHEDTHLLNNSLNTSNDHERIEYWKPYIKQKIDQLGKI